MKKFYILLFFINLFMSCTSFDELVESVINKSSSSIIFFSKSSSVFSYVITNLSSSSYQTSLISSVVYTSFSSSSEGIKIILKNGFEISDGFTNITESDWIRNTSYGIWEAKSIYVNTTSKISGSLGAGLNSNADYLIFPVLSNIGLISFKARANTNTAKYNIYIYYSSSKVNWYLITNLSADGSNNGDIITTSREYLIDANLIGLYYLKLSMSNRNTGVFYIDDIIVFENTNTNIFSSSSSDYSSSFNSISSIGLSSSSSIDNTSSESTSEISSSQWSSISSSEGLRLLINNGFEVVNGFSNISESDWLRTNEEGEWEGKSVYVNSLAKYTGSLGLGMNANNDYIRLPILENPGDLSFYGKTSGLTAQYKILIEKSKDLNNWAVVTNIKADGSNTGEIMTNFNKYEIEIKEIGLWYIRIKMTNRSSGSFYIDEIKVYENTNTNIMSSSSESSENSGESSSQESSISSSEGVKVLIYNGFEIEDGFTNISETNWVRTNKDGEWVGNSVYINATAKYIGSLGLGMNENNDYVRLPVITNAGEIEFWARTSGLTANYKIIIEKSKDLNNWVIITNLLADGNNSGDLVTNFNKYNINLEEIGECYFRIKMTNRSGGSFYLDEIKVYENTNTNITSSSSSEMSSEGSEWSMSSIISSSESSEGSIESSTTTSEVSSEASSSQYSSISSSESIKLLINNEFELTNGFTSISESSWYVTNTEGEWEGYNVYVGSTAKYSGNNGLGMNENNDYVRLPLVENPGEMEFYGKSSGLTAVYKIIIEKSIDRSNWIIITNLRCESNSVGEIKTNFNKYVIGINEVGGWYIKIKMTNRGNAGSFYLDEIKVYENTNTNIVSSSSSEASSIVSSSTISSTSSSELSSSEETSLVSSSESSEGSTTSSESSSEENSSQWSSNSSSEASISSFSSSLSSEYSSESSSQESSESSISISSSSEQSQSSSISSSEDSSIISSYSSLSDESSSSSSSVTSSQSSILATNTISIYFRMPNWPDTFTDLKLWYNLNGGNGWSSEYLIASYPISNTWYSKSINVIDPTNDVEIMIQFKANNNTKVLVKDDTFNDQPNGGWLKTNTTTGVISIDATTGFHFNIQGDRFWLDSTQITTSIPDTGTNEVPFNFYLDSPPNKTLRFIFKNWNTNQRIYIPGDWNDWDPFNFCFDYSNTSLTNDITNVVILENIFKGEDSNTIEFKILNEKGNWNSAWYFDDTWTLSNITTTDFQRQLMISCIANDLVTVTFDIGNKNISAKSEYIIEDFENYPTGWQVINGMTETIETTDKVWGNQSVRITGTFVTNGGFYFNTNLLINSIDRSYISFWMKGLTYTQSLTNKRLVIQAKPTSVCWYLNSSNITNNLIIEHNTNANYIGNTTTLNIWREIKLDLSIFKHTNFFLEFRGPSNFICDILIDRISLVK